MDNNRASTDPTAVALPIYLIQDRAAIVHSGAQLFKNISKRYLGDWSRLKRFVKYLTHTDTQTHRHTDTKTHRHTDTQAHTHKHTHTQTHRHTGTQTHRHTDTQTHRHTHTQTDRQDRQTHTYIHTYIYIYGCGAKRYRRPHPQWYGHLIDAYEFVNESNDFQ